MVEGQAHELLQKLAAPIHLPFPTYLLFFNAKYPGRCSNGSLGVALIYFSTSLRTYSFLMSSKVNVLSFFRISH